MPPVIQPLGQQLEGPPLPSDLLEDQYDPNDDNLNNRNKKKPLAQRITATWQRWFNSVVRSTRLLYVRIFLASVSVTDFGAIADSYYNINGTDNLPFFQAAIAYLISIGGGTLLIPATGLGAYGISDTWALGSASSIIIQGVPHSYDDAGPNSVQPAALIIFNSRPMISSTASRYIQIKNLTLDANNLATKGFYFDRILNFKLDTLSVVKCPGTGYHFDVSSNTTGNDANIYGDCTGLSTEVCSESIKFSGTVNSGTFMVTFNSSRFGFYGIGGIRLQNCDDITWIQTFTFRESGTGQGVRWEDNGLGNIANSIYFYHLQASAGGIYIDPAATQPGAIYGYDMSNDEPDPRLAIPANCSIAITTDAFKSIGWIVPQVYIGEPSGITQTLLALVAGSGIPANAAVYAKWRYFRSGQIGPKSQYQANNSGDWFKCGSPYVGSMELFLQHADIAPTILDRTDDDAMYRICIVAECTVVDAGCGNLSIQFAWTDDVTLRTHTLTPMTMNTVTTITDTFLARSPAIGIAVSAGIVSGAYGNARFALIVTSEKLT